MTVPRGDLRFEKKFVASPVDLPTLERWVLSHRAGFRTAYPTRWVNSLYFDDWALSAYAENLSGVRDRTKIRFRWYGEPRERVSGNLELKCKRDNAGWKLTYPAGSIPLFGSRWSNVLPRIREQLPPEPKLAFDSHPQPVLINRYSRRYFVSRDERVRVTIDSSQRVFDQRKASGPQIARAANLPDAVIMEMKSAIEDRSLLEDAIQGAPIRVSRHSKYMVGVHAILIE